jgi:hypothetical protein
MEKITQITRVVETKIPCGTLLDFPVARQCRAAGRRVAEPFLHFRSCIAGFAPLALLLSAAQGVRVDAVAAAETDQRRGYTWLVAFPHG